MRYKQTIVEAGVLPAHRIIAGVEGYRIVVVNMVLMGNGTSQVTFQDDTATLLDLYLINGAPVVLPDSEAGWTRTRSGESLNMSITAAISVGGILTYALLPATQEP